MNRPSQSLLQMSLLRTGLISLLALCIAGCSQSETDASSAEIQAAATQQPKPVNVLYIMADDLGFSDIAPFGGEINTPNLSRLAAEGTRFTNYHTAIKCNPTRAMFHTGMDNNLGATGPRTNYQINPDTATMPEILSAAGYHTFLAGKWDNGSDPGEWPADRGYAQSWAMLGGAGTHYFNLTPEGILDGASEYAEGNEKILPPQDYYSSITFTEQALSYIDTALAADQPFFGFLAFTAPHYPLQAPQEYIDRYEGVYEAGYEAIRQARLQRIDQMNLLGMPVTPWPAPELRIWSDLSDEDKALEVKRMQVYAAMVELMDEQIGRVLQHLEAVGELDNTLILFSSDNGADGTANGAGLGDHHDNSVANIGTATSFVTQGPDWARVSSTPLRLIKTFSTEGGTRVPMMARWPGHIPSGEINNQLFSVMDILPTVAEVTGTALPNGSFEERQVLPVQGRSALPLLTSGQPIYSPEDFTFHTYVEPRLGASYVRRGDWKLAWWQVNRDYVEPQLFNLADDPGETANLADEYPEIAEALWNEWLAYAERTGLNLEDTAP